MGAGEKSDPPEIVVAAGGGQRFWLRFSDHDAELAPGEVVLGRSPRCQILLDDPMVSRRHARVVLEDGVVFIEDLDSVNGVLVNGERLREPRKLASGDRVVIGQQSFEFYAAPRGSAQPARRNRFAAQTLSGVSHEDLDRSDMTHQGDAFELLTGVVEKVLVLGRGEEAERILGNYLTGLLDSVKGGRTLQRNMADKAATYAVRIAEATGKGAWVDFAFELFSALKLPLPAPLVERLYTSLRGISAINLATYRRYVELLADLETKFGPNERFVARRIRGLEALASTK